MKYLNTTLCLVLLTLSAVTIHAQSNRIGKSPLFAAFPSTIQCTEAQLSSMFTVARGQSAHLTIGGQSSLSGPVISNQVKYSNLQTMVIKLPAFKDALFSLSKQVDADNKINYVGRIMNPQYKDGFELKRSEDGNYQLIKIDLEKILVDCSQ